MSIQYVSVQWNAKKRVYDVCLMTGIGFFIAAYLGVSFIVFTGEAALSPMILLIRAFATCAFVMLTLILCIGPLCRLAPVCLPLLYNRRHFGVSMFFVALVHGVLAILWYHGFGVENPLVSLFSMPDSINSFADLPFQPFGFIALLILLLMAATSHDYWNANLGPLLWKSLHMLVYLAYGLVVLHLAAGAMQESNTGIHTLFVAASVLLVGGLHLTAGMRETQVDGASSVQGAEWLDVGCWQDIENNRGIVVSPPNGERIAIFRYDESRIAAVGNACKHQLGPLGEGRVIDGCITCPWHGYQYRPEDGAAPAPFTEKIPTYRVKLDGDRILLDPTPLPDGTSREIAVIGGIR
ncbi:MAG: sulfoxide reductase heme-binding subunit YedZ [Candidatus Azotimanducaceae bacterium]|jgi:sulfoxide reductase heme-binding subunit YedZ